VCLQSAVWYLQSNSLFHNTYKADGFYWLNPQILKMLFGFDGGFFIYTPLCFLFLAGLIVIYKESRFAFFASAILLLVLFYFFASYWAYTYFDGIGIRVLVDYYALFAFFGAKLFQALSASKLLVAPFSIALFFMALNLVYCYQVERNIVQKAGMTFAKWKYVFFKTGQSYQGCLGGCFDFKPFSRNHPDASLSNDFQFDQAFDYSKKEFGVVLHFDTIKFNSNRIHLKIDVARKDLELNASQEAMICAMLDDGITKEHKAYFQFKLNETPASECCDSKEYHYTANMVSDFKANDRLSVYLWNIKQQPFLIDKFSVKVYNYNYQIL
jgi:signal transduction histidine kinase